MNTPLIAVIIVISLMVGSTLSVALRCPPCTIILKLSRVP
jgi:hypothetical protein